MTETRHELRIVAAGPDDAATVHGLVRGLAAHEGALAHLASTEDRWRELLADDAVVVLLAVVDCIAVGYVSAVRTLHLWSGREVLALDDLYVGPDARDGGVGAALMRALADRHPGLRITWQIEEGNLRGQRFYVRLGAQLRRKVVAWWDPPPAATGV